MKNNGFFSVYALLWLNIVCAGALLIIFSAIALQNAKKDMNLYDAQIAAIYRTKLRMKEMNQCMLEKEREKENNTDSQTAEMQDDTLNHESDETLCIAEPEQMQYHDVLIRLEYEQACCTVRLNEQRLKIIYDIASLSIIDLE